MSFRLAQFVPTGKLIEAMEGAARNPPRPLAGREPALSLSKGLGARVLTFSPQADRARGEGISRAPRPGLPLAPARAEYGGAGARGGRPAKMGPGRKGREEMAAEAMEEPIDVDLPKSLRATRLGGSRICASRARRSATRWTM